jgi:serine/threonine protein kinase
MDSNE